MFRALLGIGNKAPEASQATLQDQLISALAVEVVSKKELITDTDATVNELQNLNENLALLELLVDSRADDELGRTMRSVLQNSDQEQLDAIRHLREFIDPEARQFLLLLARVKIESALRKESITALLYNPQDGENEFVRTLFYETGNDTIREAAIYAFEPLESSIHRAVIISEFTKFSPRLRCSALELLLPYKSEQDVKDFLTNAVGFSAEDHEYIRGS
jgi:hypothetical protein